ncbi:MAG: pyridoxamine 5'-phosphate oxidase family protein [Oscillospiraceae bacterium]|nr:pyridoxamine 5'-phosphate oxidase family protein [Oscillospiraceae bacterium]
MIIRVYGEDAAAHALCWKLAESRHLDRLFCTPGNAGTQALCEEDNGECADFTIPAPQLCWEKGRLPGERQAVCLVSDGKKKALFPVIHIADNAGVIDSDTCGIPEALLNEIPPERGFFTIEWDGHGDSARIFRGLSGEAACLSLAMLKGDLTALLKKIRQGFDEGFSLEFRDGTAALRAITGEDGMKIDGLADLEGDIGVFLNAAVRAGDHLRTTGKTALYLCARDKTDELCAKKIEKAASLVCLSPDFRPMRRLKQQTDRETCVSILKNEKRGVLAVNGENGYPYAIPVDFYFDEETDTIYIHGAMSGYKIDAIRADSRVCFTVWNKGYQKEDWSYHVTSVVCFGRAGIMENGEDKLAYTRLFGQKYYPSAPEVEEEIRKDYHRMNLLFIKIEHMTGKLVHEK